MNMITGYIESTSGEIIVNGYSIDKKPKKVKRQIGYMPEGVPLYTDLTVKEFVTYMAEIKKVDRKTRKEKVEKIIEQTGLKDVDKKLIKKLKPNNIQIDLRVWDFPINRKRAGVSFQCWLGHKV